MRYALAPMEGVTGYLYRNAHAAVFGPADKYLTPFVSPTVSMCFTHRELQDIMPEHNEGLNVVPQILANNSDHFIWAARAIEAMGYREVNLNLGCPSGTVTSKGKGAGFLAYPDRLEQFLDEIFSQLTVDISIKTRLGKTSPDEFAALLELFNRYPICELTIHPRVQTDLYRGRPHMESFRKAAEGSRIPLCYNGDLFTLSHLSSLSAAFPNVDCVMAGRGVLANPALLREFGGGKPAEKEEVKAFHDKLYADYRQVMPGSKPVLAKMKELWAYLIFCFTNREQYVRPLRKATRLEDYEEAISRLFQEQDIIPGGTFDPSRL